MAAHRLDRRRPDHHLHGARPNRMHPRPRHHTDLAPLAMAAVLGALLCTGLTTLAAAHQADQQPVLAAVTRCEPSER